MRGIVEVKFTNGETEIYEVDDSSEAITVWDAGMTQITPDDNHCILINNAAVRKINCEPVSKAAALNGN